MVAMARHDALLAEKRRILQLETLYDLAIALHAQRPEQELVDELHGPGSRRPAVHGLPVGRANYS